MSDPSDKPENATADALRDRLRTGATRYEFFQAVRSLALAGGGAPVGHDFDPGDELVRFSTHVSLAFPPGQITAFTDAPNGDEHGAAGPPTMEVAFLGLAGPAGVLPRHYTETLIGRVRSKDNSLRDFLDLFHHRILSLFYRAWEKHRVAPLLENGGVDGEFDRFTKALASVVALGPQGTRERFDFDDRVFLYYGGVFARQPRCASSLRRLVEEFLGIPTRIEQLVGQWLHLEARDQTQLSGLGRDGNCGLGVSAIAGERVWDVQSKFRLRLGPVSYRDFLRLAPGGSGLRPLGQLVRSYVGPEFDFDIQPVLRRGEAPDCQLDADDPVGPRLGWNTWLHAEPIDRDVDDAVFVSEGAPTR